ncbi:MAG TPA: DNA helicase UvrD [Candidatus Magasanikbacteria bacterium]|nr:MAG: hypothetical protein A3I74_01905 [Candidatus Magasanikbacteria bacterium RIFCSPLOWO2_02_FULL_47_16]OGH79824.1 MAG: hypothetical protein A3C10_05185 [Candidatus Magasanikbacteria bacterium RIFCSPHIGHO2_02_FULL_48_18]OGH83046.1 MAG: hypothetical protein A3G08_01360 [Candidatus Magasanikbacteria bacterium RIFCSPLOWO2_12_FULL_47_9b]HAZ28339.1 DNA helicase UvrD [Candidatus Magasanikbacteria bacterium]
MLEQVLDLHIHSKYSRACSKKLILENIARACSIRGIDIVATGDFTHPAWFAMMKESLVEDAPGLYRLKDMAPSTEHTRFLIGTEIASIRKHKGKTRRVHLLIFAPDMAAAERFNTMLKQEGFNLTADGRPILGRTCKEILEMMLATDERMVMIPAHAWTPWFGIFGSKGGYDSLEEAFDELRDYIFAIETGLSSDPLMNWRCSWLDSVCLISNSDAHSCEKLGREANVFQFDTREEITYEEVMRILRAQDQKKFLYTIEFYPEEGKYHLDGHRDCRFVCSPEDTKKYGGLCPTCKRPLVIGVLHRVVDLSDRSSAEAALCAKKNRRIPYKSIVPLPEVIADAYGVGAGSKRVHAMYMALTSRVGSEFYVLLQAPLESIAKAADGVIADAIHRVRLGSVAIVPGYDGVFGTVSVFGDDAAQHGSHQLGFDLD